jgi:DNA polymerase-1
VVYLIDASVYVFRAWHSMPPDIADRDGNPTQALFDESHGSCFRHRLYPPYKANREAAPAALKRQFALCREFCRHIGVAEFASPDYEADDLIGTLAQHCRDDGLCVTVVSRDKDLAQLIAPGDVFWDYSDAAEYRYEEIAARFGVRPERMADYQALRGDSVDNVPGVPGVGAKTAAALMGLFASLDELFEGLYAVVGLPLRGAAGLPQRLRLHREAAYMARSLTRIVCDAPIGTDTPRISAVNLQRRAPDLAQVATFCDTHGFGSLLRRQAERLTAHTRAA